MKKKLTKTLLAACSAALFIFAGAAGADEAPSEPGTSAPSELRIEIADGIMEGYARGRVVAVNGVPVAQAANQGGIAEDPGDCDGLCGDDNEVAACSCDQRCFYFDDCCEDVCKDCPTLLGCQEGVTIDLMYLNPVAAIPHPGGFGVIAAVSHGATIVADNYFAWSGGEVVTVQLSVLNSAAGGANTTLVNVALQIVFYELDGIEIIDGLFVGTASAPVEGNELYVIDVIAENIFGDGLPPGFVGGILVDIPDALIPNIPQQGWVGYRYVEQGTEFSGGPVPTGGVLENLGQLLRFPSTFGSSFDRVWWSNPTPTMPPNGVTTYPGLAAGGFVPHGLPVSGHSWAFIGSVDYIGACGIGDIPVPVDCPGDITDNVGGPPDGVVNGFDLLFLLGCWGTVTSQSCEPADLTDNVGGDPDGIVNGFDLLLLLGNWGPCDTNGVAGTEFECRLLNEAECLAQEGQFTNSLVNCAWPGVFTEEAAGACCFANGGCLSPTGATPQSAASCAERVLCCHGEVGTYTDCEPLGTVEDGEVTWMTADVCVNQLGGTAYFGQFQGEYVLCVDAQCGCQGSYEVLVCDPKDPKDCELIEDTACNFGVNHLGTCFCDAACIANEDCCLNACIQCADLSLPEWQVCAGCDGNCGSPLETAGECFCDAACATFGDCCPDFCDFCFDTNPSFCPQPEEATCGDGWCGLDADTITALTPPEHVHSCSCDDNCIANPDNLGTEDPNRLCCLDICQFCPKQGAANPDDSLCPDPEDCIATGSCGGISPGGCWCDPTCCSFQDCCFNQFECAGSCPNDHFLCGDGPGYCGGLTPGNGPGQPACSCAPTCCINQNCCADVLETCDINCADLTVDCPTELAQCTIGSNDTNCYFEEPEVCGSSTNDTVATATPINCGQTACGTTWLAIDPETGTITRDADWYVISITQPLLVEICLTTEFSRSTFRIISGSTGQTVATLPASPPGLTSCNMLTLEPGTYWLGSVLPVSTQQTPEISCSGNNAYTLEINCFESTQNCIGQCGNATGVGGLQCGCDAACFDRGDCCVNVCEICAEDDEATDANCQSCAYVNNPCGESGAVFSTDGTCRCDEGCCPTQSCCFDKFQVCDDLLADPNCNPVDFLTCEGVCGGYGPIGCFCDATCFFFGDCCPDICTVCDPCSNDENAGDPPCLDPDPIPGLCASVGFP